MTRATNIFSNRPVTTKATSKNREGYPAWERPLEEQYIQTLLTNTFGNTYYANQKSLIAEAEKLHNQMIAKDPGFVAKALVYARNKGYMRTQPIYGLARLSFAPKPYFESVFSKVILTPKDLSDFVTILHDLRGNEGGRRIKRVISEWLVKHLSPYWVIKYGADKNEGYSISDLIRISHPTFNGESNPLFAFLLNKEVDINSIPQIREFEALKRAKEDSEKVRLITEGRLPHEVATSFAGNSKEVWDSIVPQLPIFALLRNLATLERHGVIDNHRSLIEGKFNDPIVISNSKILPYRFLDAINHVNTAWVKDALRGAVDLSFENIPDIKGTTVIGLDVSGSMSGDYIKTASIFGIALMKKTNLNGRFYTFDTRLSQIAISKRDSILTQADRIHAGGGTNTSLPIDQITKEGYKTDNFILITDEQQNTGEPFANILKKYKDTVNGNVKTFIIDVSPYRNALTPSWSNIYYITGWSEQVLNFISLASEGWDNIAEYIRQS